MSYTVDYTNPNLDNRPMLNWHQAQELLDAGFAVELPEFRGWWFKKDGQIFVRTREGELLDSPWIETYKDRNDWRVSLQTMDFSQAIRFAFNGVPTKRPSVNHPVLRRSKRALPNTKAMMLYGFQVLVEQANFELEDFLVAEDWRMVELDALLPGQG